MSPVTIASAQLARMRGMTAMYHRRFFFDVNATAVLTIALFVVGWAGIQEAFLLIPVVALIGAVQTAFDASYLVFARTYAARLEQYINDAAGSRVLVGAELEDAYLFELGATKVVTIPLSGGFTWFSFVTIFYTVLGVSSYLFGFVAGWGALADAPPGFSVSYVVVLTGLTFGALVLGIWWFVGGVGERRLEAVLDERFGEDLTPAQR